MGWWHRLCDGVTGVAGDLEQDAQIQAQVHPQGRQQGEGSGRHWVLSAQEKWGVGCAEGSLTKALLPVTPWLVELSAAGITELSSHSISMRKGALLVFWHVTPRWQGAQIQSGTHNSASHCRLWQCWAPRLSLLWHSPSFPLPTLPFATAARPPLLFLHNVSIITCQASAYRPGMVNKRLLCLKNVAGFTINLVLQMHTMGAIDTEANTHINMWSHAAQNGVWQTNSQQRSLLTFSSPSWQPDWACVC